MLKNGTRTGSAPGSRTRERSRDQFKLEVAVVHGRDGQHLAQHGAVGVLVENGRPTQVMFAVTETDKNTTAVNQGGSKVLVVPFDGVRFDCETATRRRVPSSTSPDGGTTGAPGAPAARGAGAVSGAAGSSARVERWAAPGGPAARAERPRAAGRPARAAARRRAARAAARGGGRRHRRRVSDGRALGGAPVAPMEANDRGHGGGDEQRLLVQSGKRSPARRHLFAHFGRCSW